MFDILVNAVAVFLLLLTALSLLLSLYASKKRKQIYKISDPSVHIQGPPMYQFLLRRYYYKKHVSAGNLENVKRYGKTFMSFFLFRSSVTVTDPEDAKNVMLHTKSFPKGQGLFTKFTKRFLGDNVVFADGSDWKRQRSVMNPAFYKLDGFVDSFSSKTKEVLEQWRQLSGGAGVDVHDYMQRMTLDILGVCAFGHDFGYTKQQSSRESPNDKALAAYNYIMGNMFNLVHLLLPVTQDLSTAGNVKLTKSLDELDELVYSLIAAAKEKLRDPSYKPSSLLDMMVQSTMDENAENKLTDKELRDNVVIFFFAGHETTAVSLCFALYSLAKYPLVQEKLYQELSATFKAGKQQLSYEKLMQCEYLHNVIRETMRMYPPVTAVPVRKTVKNEEIGGYRVPKGTNINLSVYALHHDEEQWRRPFEFRPERFEAEESKGRHPFSYMPFGAGSRLCIGNNFSLLEQRVFLTELLLDYKVELTEPNYTLKVDPFKFILNPSADFKLKITPRR